MAKKHKIKRVIHVVIWDEAPDDEIEQLEELLADTIYDMPRGKWDPMIWSHTNDCEDNPHHKKSKKKKRSSHG